MRSQPAASRKNAARRVNNCAFECPPLLVTALSFSRLRRQVQFPYMKSALTSLSSRVALIVAVVCLAAILGSQPAPREQVGPLPNGTFLLNSGWRLDPAGKQVPLDTLPMSSVLSPDGKYLLVLNAGYRPPSVSVIETASGRVAGNVKVPDAWLGLTFLPKSDKVYVGGGSRAAVYEYTFANGTLQPARTFEITPS